MVKLILLFLLLFSGWLVFSGLFEPFYVISGAVSCLIAIYISIRMGIVDFFEPRPLLNFRSPLYFIWLAKEILLSAFDVTRRVWKIAPDISPTLARIKDGQDNDCAKVIYANSITLTPGTISVDLIGNEIVVHALTKEGISGLKSGVMQKKVMENFT